MNTVEVLEKARAYVERGWCQGRLAEFDSPEFYHDEDVDDEDNVLQAADHVCSVCIQGALLLATGKTLDVDGGLWALMAEAIGSDRLHVWNDAEEREKDEVIAAFDRAIALAKSRKEEA